MSTTINGKTSVMVDEAEGKYVSVNYPKSVPKSVAFTADAGARQGIYDFLAKPVIVRSGSLAATDTVSTFADLLVLNSIGNITIMKNKLYGYLGFRGSAVYTLQVNGNKFQQGRYILAWLPSGGSYLNSTSSGNSACWNRMHRFTKTQITQLPHVELDIACDTSVTLKIPYAACYSSTPIGTLTSNKNNGDLGFLVMVPYQPLASATGSTTATFTLWGHFEDVELLGNTVPQMGWEPQMGRSSGRAGTATEREQVEGKIGPIGSTLKKVSLAASEVAKVPFLTTFAMPVKWAADIAANVAYIFGWSSPLNLSPIAKIQNSPLGYLSNADAPNNSRMLALMSRNEVGVLPGFGGNDIDEMSIDYIKSIPAWIETLAWTTAATKDTVLWSTTVKPDVYVAATDDSISLRNYPPVGYVSLFFHYYRGSMTYTFKFSKTSFHSGRLLFVYAPYEIDAGAAPTIDITESAYAHRTIVDIRENSEIILNIPFMSNRSWRSCGANNDQYGSLYVYVLDPLIAPASVSSTVHMMVEVAGGPDLEFAVMANSPILPVVPTAPQSGWEPQMDPGCMAVNSTIGGAKEGTPDTLHSQATMGESIKSFRLMLKRYMPLLYGADAPTAATNLVFAPFSWPVGFIATATLYKPQVMPDLYGNMCSVFALGRGGVRVATFDNTMSSNYQYIALGCRKSSVSSEFGIYTYTSGADDFDYNYGMSARAVVRADLTGAVEVQVPQYHAYHSRTNQDNMMINTTHTTLKLQFNKTSTDCNFLDMKFTPNMRPTLYRAGADDTNFGLFVSIPPLFIYPDI